MFEKECVPFAPSLIESMRAIGYSFSSAIADLIDNSISAKAKCIDILSDPGNDPSLFILDDGTGMSAEKLYEAMRYGSRNPLEERSEDDLGRFGLGLKSASLSQCRKLVVVSKQHSEINSFAWDIDYVIKTGDWTLKGYVGKEIDEIPNVELLKGLETGTLVWLSDFDRIKEGTQDLAATFNKYLDDMNEHLSLVFHRFIEDGLVININNLPVKAKDPFLSYHKATQKKQDMAIYINNKQITLKPYILPHLSKLSQEDIEKIGGKENLKSEQGFYVYRNKRLIIWGTWFRLEYKDELNKLARVRVDIPNSLDYMWSIDIKKSTATLPDIIKKNLFNAVYESVASSETVHTYRGRKEKKDKDIEYIWERVKVRDGYKYEINRNLPQFKILEETLNDKQLKYLDNLMNSLEEFFPVQALYVDAAKGNINEKQPAEEDPELIDKIWEDLQVQISYVKNNNLAVADYYKAFMKVEPYCNHKEIKNRIEEELKKYE